MILGSAPVPYISVWVLIPSILEGGEVIADALVSGTPGSSSTIGSGSTTTGSGSTSGVIVTVSGGGVIVIVSGGGVIVTVLGGVVVVVPPAQAASISIVASSPTANIHLTKR